MVNSQINSLLLPGLGVTSTTDSDSSMLVFLYGDGSNVHSDESSEDKASASTSGAWTVLSITSGINSVAATASATPMERKTGQNQQLSELSRGIRITSYEGMYTELRTLRHYNCHIKASKIHIPTSCWC